MSLSESWDELEQKEESLRHAIGMLSDDQRQTFYKAQRKELKDPDTYAALNWLFIGGVHHLYLGKNWHFAIEIVLLVTSLLLWLTGYPWALLMLVAMTLYELPQLFFSQKIVRQHNFRVSQRLLDTLTGS